MRRILQWRDWAGEGLEHAEVRETADAYVIDSVVIGTDNGNRYAMTYRLVCDDRWAVKEATLRVVGTSHSLSLRSDGHGRWIDHAGRALEQLNGCADIDITCTPLTNTLPIRRLRLSEDESAVIRVAYVTLPTLAVTAEEQRYTRLAGRAAYRLEALGGEFSRDIEVDDDGFVVVYPDLFRRAD